MTGGIVVILGKTGRNLAAGMSGGVAYVLDENHDLYKRMNHELVKMYDIEDATELKALIEQHAKETGSEKAKQILADFESFIPKFKKIIPNDYNRMLTEIASGEASGMNHDDAVMAAFKKITA